jgi:methylated-DNA-[protein]-cysteine S-methyltransferase
MYFSTLYRSPIGDITLACRDDKIVGLWIKGQKFHGDTIPEKMVKKNDCRAFDAARKWLDKYFAGQKPAISELPLMPVGGKFRQEVWNILRKIPYGKTITYGDIAKKMSVKMGRKNMSSRAVGWAVGHNPISIVIPCHRVVGSNGNLTGYAGGIDTKIKLLELEGADMSNLFVPKNLRKQERYDHVG